MSLCIFFQYNSGSGDRYRLEVTDADVFYFVHETAQSELVGNKTELRGESDERKIEAGLNMIDDLASNLISLNESVDTAFEGLQDCRRKMVTLAGS
jgi:uncharacterized protein (DUF1810 family)